VAAVAQPGSIVEEREQAPAVAPPKALVSRGLDFWLLGGASIVCWALISALEHVREQNWAVRHHFENLPYAFSTLSLVVNYPHFMASYKLGYARGWRFVARHPIQLVLAPLALALLLALAYVWYLVPATAGGAFTRVGNALRSVGFDTELGRGVTRGQEIVTALTAVMFLAVGWHYAKQAYGAMMVVANQHGYPLDARAKLVSRASLHGIWIVNYLNANFANGNRVVRMMAWSFCAVAAMAFVWFVLVNGVRHNRRWPPATFVVPYVAFAVWWLPPLIHETFLIHVVPFFHGLQYLAFVHKVEHTRLSTEHPQTLRARGVLYFFALVVTGFVAWELLPNLFDARLDTETRLGGWFFLSAATIFLNLQHYLIDNVVWRLRDADTRRWLLS
jgi:hypothetical protein